MKLHSPLSKYIQSYQRHQLGVPSETFSLSQDVAQRKNERLLDYYLNERETDGGAFDDANRVDGLILVEDPNSGNKTMTLIDQPVDPVSGFEAAKNSKTMLSEMWIRQGTLRSLTALSIQENIIRNIEVDKTESGVRLSEYISELDNGGAVLSNQIRSWNLSEQGVQVS